MKRMVELTDYFIKDSKEYVDIDSITNIIPKRHRTGFFLQDTVLVGSTVYSGGMDSGTHVRETPAQIIEMIKNKNFALEY